MRKTIWIAIVLAALVMAFVWARRESAASRRGAQVAERDAKSLAQAETPAAPQPVVSPMTAPVTVAPPKTVADSQNRPVASRTGTARELVADSQSRPAAARTEAESKPGVVRVDGPPIGAAVAGERVSASVRVGEKRVALVANQVGVFQRVYVEPKAVVPVELSYPEARAGEQVMVQVVDGGALDSGRLAEAMRLDAARRLAFSYQATDQPGIHRVVLQKGADEKVLDFWVGAPTPLRKD